VEGDFPVCGVNNPVAELFTRPDSTCGNQPQPLTRNPKLFSEWDCLALFEVFVKFHGTEVYPRSIHLSNTFLLAVNTDLVYTMATRIEEPINISAGRNLALLLEARDIRQNELARRIRKSPSTINLILKGRRGMSQQTKNAISRELRVHPSFFDIETELSPSKLNSLLAFQELLALPETDPRYTAIKAMIEILRSSTPPS